MIVFMVAASVYAMTVYCHRETDVMVAGLGVLCLIIVSIPLFFRHDYSLFEPLTFVILLVAFGTTFKLIYILSQISADNHYVVERLLNRERIDVFVKPLLIVTGGWLFFLIGYSWRFKTRFLESLYLPAKNEWDGKRLQLILVVLSVISVTFFAAFIATSEVSLSNISAKRFASEAGEAQGRMFSLKYWFYRGAGLSKFVVYLTLSWVLHRRKPLSSWVGIWFLASLAQTCLLAFVMNSRAAIVLVVIDCMVITFYLRKTLDIKKVVIGALVVVGLSLPILANRAQEKQSIGKLVEKTTAGRDMLDISKTCHIINAIPDKMKYRYGETLYGWMAAPIPKSMWPDKPMWAARGPYINQHVFGDKLGLSGVPPGYLAELYWSFGFLGIWVGLFVTGLLFRQLFLSFIRHSSNPTSVLIYTMIVTRFGMMTVGIDLGTGIVKTILDLAPLLVMLWYVGYHQAPVDDATPDRNRDPEMTPLKMVKIDSASA